MNQADIIAEITVSPLRRMVGSGAVALSGALLLLAALSEPPESVFLQLCLWVLAAALISGAIRLYRDTSRTVQLTSEGLQDCAGEVITPLSDIIEIERGHFGMRPSNGFALKLKREAQPVWRVGLWWRAGKRAGIGGAASAAEVKKMAEALESVLGHSALPE